MEFLASGLLSLVCLVTCSFIGRKHNIVTDDHANGRATQFP